jgi:hypothetical protein
MLTYIYSHYDPGVQPARPAQHSLIREEQIRRDQYGRTDLGLHG